MRLRLTQIGVPTPSNLDLDYVIENGLIQVCKRLNESQTPPHAFPQWKDSESGDSVHVQCLMTFVS